MGKKERSKHSDLLEENAALKKQNNDLMIEVATLRSKLLMLQCESKYLQVPMLTIKRESAASKNDADWKAYCKIRGITP